MIIDIGNVIKKIPNKIKKLTPSYLSSLLIFVEGNFINNSFNAINVLAKHDENYMPPELKNLNFKEK